MEVSERQHFYILIKPNYLKEHQSQYLLTCLYFLPRLKSLTTEPSVIVKALQKSKTGLLEMSEDKTKIRRSADKPLPEMNDDYKDALKHKSVYMVSF